MDVCRQAFGDAVKLGESNGGGRAELSHEIWIEGDLPDSDEHSKDVSEQAEITTELGKVELLTKI